LLTLKHCNVFPVSEAASTNMKACWLFIGEWAFADIAAPDFQAFLCYVINNFFTNRRKRTMRKIEGYNEITLNIAQT
jgi:hypothetical protein